MILLTLMILLICSMLCKSGESVHVRPIQLGKEREREDAKILVIYVNVSGVRANLK
jgi:hypothetical protein